MGAILSMMSGAASAVGGAVAPVLGVVGSVMSYGSVVLSFMFEMVLELGGYAVACFSLSCGLFTGCISRMSTELLRPSTEWKGSEAKRVGLCGAFCACMMVVLCIFLCTVLVTFGVTFAWYESELLIEETEAAVG
jgi:hypothetical protein